MLVKVDKFTFPVDFVVLDVEEDSKVPLIFGRPFLATGNAEIDVAKGLMSLRVGEEKVIFKIFDLKVTPVENHEVFLIEMLKEWSDTKLEQFFLKEGFSKKKKKEKEPKNNPPEQVCAVKVVANPIKEEKAEKGGLSWKPKLKKVEVNSESNPKLIECACSLEIACKNLINLRDEIKKSQGVQHHGIDPG